MEDSSSKIGKRQKWWVKWNLHGKVFQKIYDNFWFGYFGKSIFPNIAFSKKQEGGNEKMSATQKIVENFSED